MRRFPFSYALFAFGLALALPGAFRRPEALATTSVMLVLSLILALLHRRVMMRIFTDEGGIPSDSYQEAWAKFVEAISVLNESPSEASALRALQVTTYALPTLRCDPADEKFLPNPESEPFEFLSAYLCPKIKKGNIQDLIFDQVGVLFIPALPVLPQLAAHFDVHLLWALGAAGVMVVAIAWNVHLVIRKARTRTRRALEALQALRSNNGGATP